MVQEGGGADGVTDPWRRAVKLQMPRIGKLVLAGRKATPLRPLPTSNQGPKESPHPQVIEDSVAKAGAQG